MIGQMVQIQSYEKHSTAVEEADTERQKIFSRVLQQGSNRESTITELHLEKKVVVGWKKGKVNQGRLYYLRNRSGKAARIKEK